METGLQREGLGNNSDMKMIQEKEVCPVNLGRLISHRKQEKREMGWSGKKTM